mgnify:FL=1
METTSAALERAEGGMICTSEAEYFKKVEWERSIAAGGGRKGRCLYRLFRAWVYLLQAQCLLEDIVLVCCTAL